MAELKLREAMPELSLVVVQPSIAMGHSTLGREPSGNTFWILRMVTMLETSSYRLSDCIDTLPADDYTEGIVRLATKPTLAHDLYHISTGDADSECIEMLYPRLKCCRMSEEDVRVLVGYIYQKRIVEKALARKFLNLTGDGNVRLVVCYIHLYVKFASMSYVSNNTRLVQEIGFQPCSLSAYPDRYPKTPDVVPIPEQMRWDYKQPSGLHSPHSVSQRHAITTGALHQDSGHHNKGPLMMLQTLAHLNIVTLMDSFTSLASALALGSLVGLKRQVKQRTAGLRTNVLVAVAVPAFVDVAAQIGTAPDTTRVVARVVSGVGLLGAGIITREELNVRGLNTAATF